MSWSSATLAGCRRLARPVASGPAAAAASVLAGEDFPGDIGPVLALLLNFVRLAPGEAIFLGAGNGARLSARGLRGGAGQQRQRAAVRADRPSTSTSPELVRIADFSPLAEPRWPADRRDQFRVPVPDFVLTVRQLAGAVWPRPSSVDAGPSAPGAGWRAAGDRDLGFGQPIAAAVACGIRRGWPAGGPAGRDRPGVRGVYRRVHRPAGLIGSCRILASAVPGQNLTQLW